MLQPKWWMTLIATVFCTMIAIYVIKKVTAKIDNPTLNTIVNN